MLREEFEFSLFTVQTKLLAKIAIVPSKIKEFQQNDKAVATLEAKVASLGRLRAAQTADVKDL
jgi:hypothetical protein